MPLGQEEKKRLVEVLWQIKERDQTAIEGGKRSKNIIEDASSAELSTVTRLAAASGSVHAECILLRRSVRETGVGCFDRGVLGYSTATIIEI